MNIILLNFRKCSEGSFFSVLGDEVSDVSNEEQLTLVLRFVNEFNQVSWILFSVVVKQMEKLYQIYYQH